MSLLRFSSILPPGPTYYFEKYRLNVFRGGSLKSYFVWFTVCFTTIMEHQMKYYVLEIRYR